MTKRLSVSPAPGLLEVRRVAQTYDFGAATLSTRQVVFDSIYGAR